MVAVRGERGFALLMVLWTLMLLAFIATVFSDNARTEVLLARNLVANARAEALADGGVFRAAMGLRLAPRDGGFRGDGQVYIWRPTSRNTATSLNAPPAEAAAWSAEDEVRFIIRDEGGKADLNQAPAALLRELLVAVGLEAEPSAELADAIIDFRDEDQEKQRQGAETREYKQAGLSWGPKNKPFVLVEELMYVRGMTPEIYRRIAPLVTVWGQGEAPHPYTAPPEVLTALAAALKAPQGRPSAGSRGRDTARAQSDAPGFGSSRSLGAGGFGSSGFNSGSSISGGGLGSSGISSRGGSSSGLGLGRGQEEGGSAALTEEDEAELEQQERSGGTTFTIHAEGRTADGTVFAREATVDLTGTETAPLSIRAWRQGERILFPVNRGASG